MARKVVGIIGGAGVAATNKLQEIIEFKLTMRGAIRDVQHPEMIIYQATQAPSRSMFLEGRGPSFIPEYIVVAQKLYNAGASLLCMSCNTAHYAYSEIANSVTCPFINLIEETVKCVKKTQKKRIGMLVSDGCRIKCIYDTYFSNIYPEAELIYPDTKTQQDITHGICNIKNRKRFLPNSHPERPWNIFTHAIDKLLSQGAEQIVLGCTDIRVDFYHPSYIDSTEVLANSILRYLEKDNL